MTTFDYEDESPQETKGGYSHSWIIGLVFGTVLLIIVLVGVIRHRRFAHRHFGPSRQTRGQPSQRQASLSVRQKIAHWIRGICNAIVCWRQNGASQTSQAQVCHPTAIAAPCFDAPVMGVPLNREAPIQVQLHIIAPEGIVITGAHGNDAHVTVLPNRNTKHQVDLPARNEGMPSDKPSDDGCTETLSSTHENDGEDWDCDRAAHHVSQAPVTRKLVSRATESEAPRRSKAQGSARSRAGCSNANDDSDNRRIAYHNRRDDFSTSPGLLDPFNPLNPLGLLCSNTMETGLDCSNPWDSGTGCSSMGDFTGGGCSDSMF